MEKLIKQKLIERGFSEETLLNNRGLISAVIDETKEVIMVTPCCTELPTIEELIISEIRRKHQKQVDNEVERFLSGNGTDCRLRGFFNETDLNE